MWPGGTGSAHGALSSLNSSELVDSLPPNIEFQALETVLPISPPSDLSAWPEGTRLIVRRERPHPGAQFEVFDAQGYRHTAFITDQEEGDIAVLELRHRRRARCEDAICVAKDTGIRNLPFAAFAHNQAWLELSLLAGELLSWARSLCLEGELSLAEPKRMRQPCCTSGP